MSYNKIEEYIYAGNNMCCQTHFEKELLSKGIRADISLEFERLDNPEGAEYFFWLPWKDYTAPSMELIDLGINVVNSLVALKIKTYIHCRMGHGRTSTFLASYFIQKEGVTTDEALELVGRKRPSMHVTDVQLAFLREFETIQMKKGGT